MLIYYHGYKRIILEINEILISYMRGTLKYDKKMIICVLNVEFQLNLHLLF